MEKKKNRPLSDKIKKLYFCRGVRMFPTKAYPEEYVKKAVSDLKEKINREHQESTFNEMGRRVLINIINEVFGEKLV